MSTEFRDLDQTLAEWKAVQPLEPGDEARLWRKLLLDWNYHSNRIEGNTLTYGETELLLIHGQVHGNHELRQYNEMKAHDVAIDHLRKISADARPLSEADIRDLNRILLKEPYRKRAETPEGLPTSKEIIPGEYKIAPNSVRTASGEIFHYASPEEVPMRMAASVSWLRDALEKGVAHPIEIAAKLHHDFVLIHPFDDGNGRTARLLVNHVLLKYGFLPLVVPTESKDHYLAALRLADAGDLVPLTDFLAALTQASLERGLRAARGESVADPDDLSKEIELFKRRQGKREEPPIRISPAVIRELCRSTIIPLCDEFVATLKVLDDLFEVAEVTMPVIKRGENETWRDALVTLSKSDDPRGELLEDTFGIRYRWAGYKGDGNLAIEGSSAIYFTLADYHYSIDPLFPGGTMHLYSDALSSEERAAICHEALQAAFDRIRIAAEGGDSEESLL